MKINNVRIGIDMSAMSHPVQSNVGSILLLDSSISNASIAGVLLRNNRQQNIEDVSGTLLLDNVVVDNVRNVVQGSNGYAMLTTEGRQTITSWGRGSLYKDDSGKGRLSTGNLSRITKSSSLLDSEGKFFQRSRPQYSHKSSIDFVSVKCKRAETFIQFDFQ